MYESANEPSSEPQPQLLLQPLVRYWYRASQGTPLFFIQASPGEEVRPTIKWPGKPAGTGPACAAAPRGIAAIKEAASNQGRATFMRGPRGCVSAAGRP